VKRLCAKIFTLQSWVEQTAMQNSSHLKQLIAFENGRISNFEGHVALTFDRVILYTVVRHSSTSTYMPHLIEIEATFCGRTVGQTFETHFIRWTLSKSHPKNAINTSYADFTLNIACGSSQAMQPHNNVSDARPKHAWHFIKQLSVTLKQVCN